MFYSSINSKYKPFFFNGCLCKSLDLKLIKVNYCSVDVVMILEPLAGVHQIN